MVWPSTYLARSNSCCSLHRPNKCAACPGNLGTQPSRVLRQLVLLKVRVVKRCPRDKGALVCLRSKCLSRDVYIYIHTRYINMYIYTHMYVYIYIVYVIRIPKIISADSVCFKEVQTPLPIYVTDWSKQVFLDPSSLSACEPPSSGQSILPSPPAFGLT